MLAVSEHERVISRLLIDIGASVDAIDASGRTALVRAVLQAYEEPTRRRSLAAQGVAASRAEVERGEHLAVISMLLEAGASLSTAAGCSTTALQVAQAANVHQDVKKLLREAHKKASAVPADVADVQLEPLGAPAGGGGCCSLM